jgi:hypothetical protein
MFRIKSQHREQFWEWCQKNKIECAYMGTESGQAIVPPMDTWYIGREQDRMLAVLTWT